MGTSNYSFRKTHHAACTILVYWVERVVLIFKSGEKTTSEYSYVKLCEMY